MPHKTPYEVIYLPEAKEEYDNLEGNQLVFVDKGISRLKVLGMNAGQPLHGKLINCRKLKNKKMGLRIIFTRDKEKIKIIKIIAIGARRREKVYRDAENRLSK